MRTLRFHGSFNSGLGLGLGLGLELGNVLEADNSP